MTSTSNGSGWGGQSVVDKLSRVLVYEPVRPDEHVSWQEFGYFRPIDHDQATREHATFRKILTENGAEVIIAEIGDGRLQDAIFPFDPVIITDQGAILGRMGKELRRREVDLMRETLGDLGVPIAGEIKAPGTFEGGDSFWVDEKTLAVGRGYRTNSDGIDQLRSILEPMGVEVITVDLPYWHGPDECLHLLSLISLLDRDLAVVYLPLLSVEFVKFLHDQADSTGRDSGRRVRVTGLQCAGARAAQVPDAGRERRVDPAPACRRLRGPHLSRQRDLAQPLRWADLPDASATPRQRPGERLMAEGDQARVDAVLRAVDQHRDCDRRPAAFSGRRAVGDRRVRRRFRTSSKPNSGDADFRIDRWEATRAGDRTLLRPGWGTGPL